MHLFLTLVGGCFEVLWLVATSPIVLGGLVIALFAWSARASLPATPGLEQRQGADSL